MKILGFSALTHFWIDLARLEELLKFKILVLFHLLNNSIQKTYKKEWKVAKLVLLT